MIQRISNIDEIKEKLKDRKLPKKFSISKSEVITDMDKFLDSHLTILNVDKLINRHRPYINRLRKVLTKLKIKIVISKEE